MNQLDLAKPLAGFIRFRQLEVNETGKDYFVGDLCGQFHLLQKALRKAQFNIRHDRLFTTGNFIDYGNDSAQLLDLLAEPWFYSVLGIHELLMLDALESGHYLHWYVQGGHWAFDQDIRLKVDLAPAVNAVLKLPLAYLIPQKKHRVIGLVSRMPLEDFSAEGFAMAGTGQLFDCLSSDRAPRQKAQIYPQADCIVVGGVAAKKCWARGNVVGINQGGQYRPKLGSLTIIKRKKLMKLTEKQPAFIPLQTEG
ncbi:metallophosphoesterase [Bowmanella dokdonensis]|uniref:Calcineurin-like phosphoesterase domain-containing protein n=1 Tax=Bowmanella dokdonensis TaxID=751969 RepID=A0A939DRC3_9ALTE|nr:metallophosphoesterase [Bowmanella dokdonensis]MBN7826947.1 hypothetical protein [Bowmanella dokdonensis]